MDVHLESRQSSPFLCHPMDYMACQAPLSMGFSRQESGVLPCTLPGDLPNLGIETDSLKSPALADRFFITSTTWEALTILLGAIIIIEIWHLLDNFRLQVV